MSQLSLFETKWCANKDCKQQNPQPFHRFSKAKKMKLGLASWCKKCVSEMNVISHKKHAHKYIAGKKNWKAKNREKLRFLNKKWQLKKHYNLKIEEYEAMLSKQNWACKICGVHRDQCSQDLHVDHCHITGKIRGLLCSGCNLLLGNCKENRDTLLKAITYLDDQCQLS